MSISARSFLSCGAARAALFFATALLLPALAAAQTAFSVTALNAPLVYRFNGGTNNATLTLERGKTYTFNLQASVLGHPFRIQSTGGGVPGTLYNTGVTNNGAQTGTVTFAVPMDAPSTLFYQCGNHFGMGGTLNIVNPPPIEPEPPAPRIWGDFNGDGKSDILWRNASTGENYLYPMNGTTILGSEGYVRSVTDPNWQIVAIGDFNGGGRADVLWRNSSTGENYIYFMNGTAIGPEGYLRTVTDQNWQVAGVADFDGDGKDDILWRNRASGENYVYLMDGLSIKGEGYIRTVADPGWQVAGVADFNGDGKADIFWRNGTTGDNYLYPMNGTAIASGEGYVRGVYDLSWEIVGTGDFDGDGKAGVLWRRWTSGENYIYEMNGTAIVAEGYIRTVADVVWQIAATADYDGDGKADILWRNLATGENYVYFMDGTTIKPSEGYVRTVPDSNWAVAGAAAAAGPTWVTIYDLKAGAVPMGTLVQVIRAVVTGSKPGNGFFIQVKPSDPGYNGAPNSGIFVFSSSGSVQVGDRVNVVGNVQLFNGQIQIAATAAPHVVSTGESLPTPVLAASANIATGGSQAASLEGVLVQVANVTVASKDTQFNEFTVTGGLVVDDYFYNANPAVSTTFSSITGILAYRLNGSKLLPRSAADLVMGF